METRAVANLVVAGMQERIGVRQQTRETLLALDQRLGTEIPLRTLSRRVAGRHERDRWFESGSLQR